MTTAPNRLAGNAIWNDMRFRAACVLMALIALLVWLLVKTAPAKVTIPKALPPKLTNVQWLKPGETYSFPSRFGIFQVRGAAAVLTLSHVPQATSIVLDADGGQTPLLTFDEQNSADGFAIVPRGNRKSYKGAKCVIESFEPLQAPPYPGENKVIASFDLPELQASPRIGLRPKPTPGIAASVVYMIRRDRDPLPLLKVVRTQPPAPGWTSTFSPTSVTYSSSVNLNYGPVYSRRDSYFYLPFAKDQSSVHVEVADEKSYVVEQDLELPHAEVFRNKRWPLVRLKKGVKLRCPNGMVLELPPQNLCWGLLPDISRRLYEIHFHLTVLPEDTYPQTMSFSLHDLVVNGHEVKSLDNATPLGDVSSCRLHVWLNMRNRKAWSADVPIQNPARRVYIEQADLMGMPRPRYGGYLAPARTAR